MKFATVSAHQQLNRRVMSTLIGIWLIFISLTIEAASANSNTNDIADLERIGIEPEQLLLSMPQQQSSSPSVHQQPPPPPPPSSLTNEKRSWQNLQGSWGKRGNNDYNGITIDDYELEMGTIGNNQWPIIDENEYDDNKIIGKYYGNNLIHPVGPGSPIQQQQQLTSMINNEQKRAWKNMNSAWGKRLGNNPNGDWNRFRGSWGKREPGWNNLKGLWGKRAANWNKLQSAWGKRDQNTQSFY